MYSERSGTQRREFSRRRRLIGQVRRRPYMINRETDPAFFRPVERLLVDLTNEELQALFDLRASRVQLDPKGFWDNDKIVYWNAMIPKLRGLYLIMLEIQARYPKAEIYDYQST